MADELEIDQEIKEVWKECEKGCKNSGCKKSGRMVYPKKNKWTLEPKSRECLCNWITSVENDMVNQTLKISMIEFQDMRSECWLRTLLIENKEMLTLTTYDECANELYSIIFSGLSLIEHKSKYNYADSSEASHDFTLSYMSSGIKIYR